MLTQKELKENFYYNYKTGELSWIHASNKNRLKAGRICKCLDVHGYIQINYNGHIYKGHRLVWLYVYGEMPKDQIDHINHNRADNRIENLRCVNNHINHLNRPLQSNNKTGISGVSFSKKTEKYFAYITHNGKKNHLGVYKTLEEAIKIRKQANIDFGFHENHSVGVGRKKYKRYG
jgi:hypothetical protein